MASLFYFYKAQYFCVKFLNLKIAIQSISSLSSLGLNQALLISSSTVLDKARRDKAFYLPKDLKLKLLTFLDSRKELQSLDPTVQSLLFLLHQSGLKNSLPTYLGINVSSSRGATHLFEKYIIDHFKTGELSSLASPTTTLGNISSWLANELNSVGFESSHSITCSSGLHGIVNAVAWLKSGMQDDFLVGASEFSNTSFTIDQLKALRIYSDFSNPISPSESMNFSKKKNAMVLGEACSLLHLSSSVDENSLVLIKGVGYATEILDHPVSLSADGLCMQKSMEMALSDAQINTVDVVVMHAPGTKLGDKSELKAIDEVFKNTRPALTSNKWVLGHTFATSGLLSVELAVDMLKSQKFIENPFFTCGAPSSINTIMVNAVGFGGNAVSIILERL